MSKPKFDPTKPFSVVEDAGAVQTSEKPPFDPSKPFQAAEEPSTASDFFSKFQEGALMGAKPFVAGVAGGLGSLSGGGSFSEGYKGARDEARQEEETISKRSPTASILGNLSGAVLTAPMLAARGLKAAVLAKDAGLAARLGAGLGESARVGAMLGGAEALGHADTAGQAVEMVGKNMALGAGLQLAGNTASVVAPKVINAAKSAATWVSSGLTGVPKQEIKTLADRAEKVSALMKRHGGVVSEAADEVRTATMKEIQVTRQTLNNQISEALAAPQYQNVSIDASAVMQKLEEALNKSSKITAAYNPGEINELKNVIDTTKQFIGPDGKISIQDLHEIKQQLQKAASSSYDKGTVIFPRGEIAARASKGAAAEARRLLDVAVPEMKQANQQLSRLHVIEEQMNKNLIKAGKPEAALLAAGSGVNSRSERLLASLDNMTGGKALERAQDLSAGRRFYNSDMFPADFNGKAAARVLTPLAAGTALGNPLLGVVGSALTSPTALKYEILAGRGLSKGANAVGRGLMSLVPEAGAGRAALLNDALQEVNASSRHAETATERRLRELKNKIKKDSASGQ